MKHVFYCDDTNPKKFKIQFNSGSLKKDDTWFLCDVCNQKSAFRSFRISEILLDKFDNC
ncbi:hypothetical protein AAA799E16_01312 [Marine Group I thaumarchaeote SCGC AAA799-E16]|uniref:Uncharacterized protein n=5 Tax=Marine Group I TaxID=905826 RepID=A0A087S899_9ARCH|nr:hypothetical protein AAA799N04_01434 [Marine Group I thaumarchaeote SCGC AAA799-N04]KER06011.1 hypothetical protein AAA799E16_01312 [Marine Group I thaumarchaeote SCGC AAA799-E16]KFM15702.1 hypothetical protein SCCGRSA3_02620 [Marine Group I thaumarchaeote SCGC RSA3]KFM18219.1 hypothetical protein AAA799P11_01136 [Marine Group I thaumarchaeote SCGC AAA799-P11]KFM21953.1 hypothetical protein AAA799B03_00395 [Marine Group I thaumarchaeote SCGC AAA799-B03]